MYFSSLLISLCPSLFLNLSPPPAAKFRPFITLLMLDYFSLSNARQFYSSRETIWEKGLRLNITSILPRLIKMEISHFSKLFIVPQKLKENLQRWFCQIFRKRFRKFSKQTKTRATKTTKQMTICIYIYNILNVSILWFLITKLYCLV